MAIKKRPLSPRQKMINLMYVVLMAMLALNVSTEVLNGFSIVEESLNRTTNNSSTENDAIYDDFVKQMKTNPEKVKAWFEKATVVKNMSDSLYNFAQELKEAIVKEADGEDGDVDNIIGKDNLEAANQVMLAPGRGRGKQLFDEINSFRERIVKLIPGDRQRKIIESNLSTKLSDKAVTMGKNWQEYMFEDMPVAASVTLLSKLQSDVRYAEGEVLHALVSNIDVKDVRVNKITALVVPNSQTVVRGDKFSAKILMAAVDTTQKPKVFIGGREMKLEDDAYSFIATKTGEFDLNGYITMNNGRGDVMKREFSQKYTVVDPFATVSADLMNVLYAGYDNPISVSIPGVALNKVNATMIGGSLKPVGMGRYVARPASVGKDVTIVVSSTQTGKAQEVGKYTFHVRKLPDPTAYIKVGNDRFKGGSLNKKQLMDAKGIHAAIDDGLLDIEFKVTSFEAVFFDNMGNAVPMVSDGASFSSRQKDSFRKLSRNRRFYISRVTAIGPDGISRKLPSSMEIIVK